MQRDLLSMLSGKKKAPQKPQLATTKTNPEFEPSPDIDAFPIPQLSHELPTEIRSLITWKKGESVPYSFIASMMKVIEQESGRLKIIEHLARCVCAIGCTTPKDLIPFGWLCLGELRPSCEGVNLAIGDSTLIEGISSATGKTKEALKSSLREVGDLGDVAMASKAKQKRLDVMFGKKEEALTIRGVYNSLLDIARIQGARTQRHKVGHISKLMTSAKDDELKFIVRALGGSLRIGCAESSVLVAIGQGLKMREYYIGCEEVPPTQEVLDAFAKRFKKAFKQFPVLDVVLEKMLCSGGGLEKVEKECGLTVGTPVMPMLAKPAKSTDEIKMRLSDAEITCEYKYDGERGQIHKMKDGTVKIFSRNAKDSTVQFKDIITVITENVKAESFILDSEIVAYDHEKGTILPFQALLHRARKNEEVSPVQVCIFIFDLLYKDGQSLISLPLEERRRMLQEIVVPIEHKFQLASYLDTDLDHLADFFNEAIRNRTEGLMIKDKTAPYEPGKRSQHWAKLKKDYVQGLGTKEESAVSDTVDVCVIGATMGKGRRAGVYGCYLVAVWNEDRGIFESVCEVGTGLSDDQLKGFTESMKENVVSGPRRDVAYGKYEPEVYFQPKVVWEVQAADLTLSPRAAACWNTVEDGFGISLRFSRLIRVREDKEPYMATHSDQILDMYYQQPSVAKKR